MKKSLGARTYLYPNPDLIVGTYDERDIPNIMAVAWGGICCSDPPALSVGIRKSRYSYDNIISRKAFTVNIPSVEYVEEAHYCGIKSGRDEKKFDVLGLTPVRSEKVAAPYVKEFPVNLICGLIRSVDIGSHTLFVGEILDVLADECVIDDRGQPVIEKIRPVMYDYGGTSYRAVGDEVLDARKFDPKKFGR